MYRLTKINLKKDETSLVQPGESFTGDVRVYITGGSYSLIEPRNLKVGHQVALATNDGMIIRISPVREIFESDDNHITFQTQTSTYKLEKVN